MMKTLDKRPRDGTRSVLPWQVGDELSERFGRRPTRHEIKTEVYKRAPEYAPTTFNVQFAAWAKQQAVQRDAPDIAERIAAALETIADVLVGRQAGKTESMAKLAEAARIPWLANGTGTEPH